MKVSIAMCVYNGAAYLEPQLESYINQTRQPDELVIGDDCSTDDTISILENFAETAPFPVRIHINERNLGVTQNFSETISRCKGDIIFLSDADDVWMPTKIEKILAEFEKHPKAGIVFANAELVDENLQTLNSTLWDGRFPKEKQKDARNGKFIEVLVDKNVIGGATSAVRADYKKYFLPIPSHFSSLHDGWINLMIASMAEIYFLPDLLIRYRQHSKQTSKVIWGKRESVSNYKKGRKRICEEGFQLYSEKEKDLNYFYETVKKFEHKDLLDNVIFKRSLITIQSEIKKLKNGKEHFKRRRNLSSGIVRFFQVAKEAFTGRYHKYSNGFASIVRDLIYK